MHICPFEVWTDILRSFPGSEIKKVFFNKLIVFLRDLDNPNVKITFNEKTGPISAEFVGENGTSDKTAPFPPAPGKNYIGEIEEKYSD